MTTFYLGAHHPHWLAEFGEPLMVSRRWLARRRTLPAAAAPWALDSGGFTELTLHGRWTVDAMTYSTEARGFRDGVGRMAWAACQDWMCEPHVLARTGLTVAEHQRRTVANYLLLRQLAPDLPWLPVLQGWEYADYLDHLRQYRAEGVDLAALPLVGLGSVCRRQSTAMAESLVRDLHGRGLRLHAFGFKVEGLRRCAPWLASADSMAWSLDARRSPPLPGCEGRHASCANCPRYARRWLARVRRLVSAATEVGGRQGQLFDAAAGGRSDPSAVFS